MSVSSPRWSWRSSSHRPHRRTNHNPSGTHSVPKLPWFPGESRGMASSADRGEIRQLEAFPYRIRRCMHCLPCRRSWVRIPSAALRKASQMRGFPLASGAPESRLRAIFRGRVSIQCLNAAPTDTAAAPLPLARVVVPASPRPSASTSIPTNPARPLRVGIGNSLSPGAFLVRPGGRQSDSRIRVAPDVEAEDAPPARRLPPPGVFRPWRRRAPS
jgi:hypothetical protein